MCFVDDILDITKLKVCYRENGADFMSLLKWLIYSFVVVVYYTQQNTFIPVTFQYVCSPSKKDPRAFGVTRKTIVWTNSNLLFMCRKTVV